MTAVGSESSYPYQLALRTFIAVLAAAMIVGFVLRVARLRGHSSIGLLQVGDVTESVGGIDVTGSNYTVALLLKAPCEGMCQDVRSLGPLATGNPGVSVVILTDGVSTEAIGPPTGAQVVQVKGRLGMMPDTGGVVIVGRDGIVRYAVYKLNTANDRSEMLDRIWKLAPKSIQK
jgi:hypothetical protein